MRAAILALLAIAAEEGDRDRSLHLRERLRSLGTTTSIRGAFQNALALAILEVLNGRYAAATTILEHASEGDMQAFESAEREAFLAVVYALGEDEQAASDSAQEALRIIRRLRGVGDPASRRSVELATVCAAAVSLRLGRRYEAARALATLRRSRLDAIRSLARVTGSIARGTRPPHDAQRELLAAYHTIIERLFPDRLRAGGRRSQLQRGAGGGAPWQRGNTTKEIAAYLGRSTSTVDNHIFSIMSKLKARNRLEAVMIARERNLLD